MENVACYFWRFCILVSLIISTILHGHTVDILVSWDLQEAYTQKWDILNKSGYQVRVFHSSDEYFRRHYSDKIKKIIVMEDFLSRDVLTKIPKTQLCLFMWEPIGKTEDGDFFSCVYTHNDNLVGKENYRKFYYPFLKPMDPNPIPFKHKKLCTAVISHWLPERLELINFFANYYPDQFDLYGNAPENISRYSIYKGRISGHHSDFSKINTLKKYKFFLAFENSACPRYNIISGYCPPGYITEKIFGAFAAGCVPIYYGAPNIEEYIPKDCFINYSEFQSPRDLYDYISNISEEEFQRYLDNIRKFLNSEPAQRFSQRTFELTILEAIES